VIKINRMDLWVISYCDLMLNANHLICAVFLIFDHLHYKRQTASPPITAFSSANISSASLFRQESVVALACLLL